MIKKISVYLFTVLLTVLALGFIAPVNTYAACGEYEQGFLSFPTWHRGLPREEVDDGAGGRQCILNIRHQNQGDDMTVGAIVFTIALNAIDIALRIVSLIAVAFVIMGGFQYITAQGESNKVTAGRQMVTRALIGLVIAILASAIIYFLVRTLGS